MAALRRLVSVISDGRSKKKAGTRVSENKKGPRKEGLFLFFGSGGRIAFAPAGLSYVGQLRWPRNEPASQNPTLPQ